MAVTKADEAYARLRREIVTGAIDAETSLDENELMRRFELGRTPVREALKRLALEQFVVWPPRRTPYVRTIGAGDLARLYEARLILEEHTSSAAAERASDRELAELDGILAQYTDCITRDEVYEAVELDHELHYAIARASHNRYLAEAVRSLNCGSLRLWYVAHDRLGMTGTDADHRSIVDAIRRHDKDGAAAAAREHVHESYRRQLRLHGSDRLG
jgi:DNA-binding GntR family transcriptional regulator